MDRLYETIITSVFALVGIALLAIGFVSFRRQRDFLAGAVSTSGTIVETRGPGNRPVFEFADQREHVHRVTGSVSRSHSYQRGQKVKVLYRLANPKDAQLDSFSERWLIPLVLGGMGIVFVGVAAGIGFALLYR
jgi:hypothetical protein